MEIEEFDRMVERLERKSAASPALYRANVAALALLGFAILALLLGALGFGLVALAGIALEGRLAKLARPFEAVADGKVL